MIEVAEELIVVDRVAAVEDGWRSQQ